MFDKKREEAELEVVKRNERNPFPSLPLLILWAVAVCEREPHPDGIDQSSIRVVLRRHGHDPGLKSSGISKELGRLAKATTTRRPLLLCTKQLNRLKGERDGKNPKKHLESVYCLTSEGKEKVRHLLRTPLE